MMNQFSLYEAHVGFGHDGLRQDTTATLSASMRRQEIWRCWLAIEGHAVRRAKQDDSTVRGNQPSD